MRTKKSPLISVVTICLNEGENMEKTCKSIAEQKYNNFEWVVVDGKSTDKETLNILKKYHKYMDFFVSEKDYGIYNAANKGIRLSRGEYIIFVDGGNILKNSHVLKKAGFFMRKRKSEIYYGDLELDDGEISMYKKAKLDRQFFISKTLPTPSVFIKRELFEKYGYFDENYKILADFDFWVRSVAISNTKTIYLPFIVSVFDQKGVSSNYRYMLRHIKERNRVLRKYNLASPFQESIQLVKWFSLMILKMVRLYSPMRRIYRKVIWR